MEHGYGLSSCVCFLQFYFSSGNGVGMGVRIRSFIYSYCLMSLLVGCAKLNFASNEKLAVAESSASTTGVDEPVPVPVGVGVGVGTTSPGNVTPCLSSSQVLVLNPHASHPLTLSGGATIGAKTVAVNSDSADAALLSGQAYISATNVNITGSDVLTGNASIQGKLATGAKPTADPLANLAGPSETGLLTYNDGQISGGTVTLKPGIYPNAVSISGQAIVMLQPGVYVFKAGLDLSGGAHLSGDGVLLYIAGGSLKFSGQSIVHLSPSTSGANAGVTIFQARDNLASGQLSGGSQWSLSGAVYLPTALLDLSGGSGEPQVISLIVDSLTMSGGSLVLAAISSNACLPGTQ